MDAQEFQKALRERFIERDGMFFTASQTVEYEEKKQREYAEYKLELMQKKGERQKERKNKNAKKVKKGVENKVYGNKYSSTIIYGQQSQQGYRPY